MKTASRQGTADPVQELFAKHSLRCTRQRRAMYEALASTTSHPTADQIFQRVGEREGEISLATVYNTLEAFCRAGLAQKLASNNGSARYDATVHNHLHIRDQDSGSVADVPAHLSEKLLDYIPAQAIKQLESQLGFRIQQVQIELVGRYDGQTGGLSLDA